MNLNAKVFVRLFAAVGICLFWGISRWYGDG